ncbi:hypothetical protein OXB_3356 [Bacillus sp. OxB-1]|nr:hypothetical protein OXB_3356 [Bacillus sp. OxB-1]
MESRASWKGEFVAFIGHRQFSNRRYVKAGEGKNELIYAEGCIVPIERIRRKAKKHWMGLVAVTLSLHIP